MKNLIIKLVKKQSLLLKYFRKLQRKSLLKKSFKKRIVGNQNKLIINRSAALISCSFDISGNFNKILIGECTVINNVKFIIHGSNNIVKISQDVKFNISGSIWIEDDCCLIEVGKQTSFEDVSIAVTEPGKKVQIGEDCMFAYDIDIRTGDSHSIIDITTNKRLNYAKDIIIDDHVWIAPHVSILKGVNIKKNSIVATRSVVTKSFEKEDILIGGVPAKILKENITWNRKRIY
jgi:acetyltransferase-like isoleucine patch superfamily enzyme